MRQPIKKSRMDIYYQLDDYIGSKTNALAKRPVLFTEIRKPIFIAFENSRAKVTFRSLDFNFYEEFVEYLTFDHVHTLKQERLVGLKQNTIGKMIKHLRVFCTRPGYFNFDE